MTNTTTWRHTFTNYDNLTDINMSGQQEIAIYQPLAAQKIRLELNNLYDDIPLEITSLILITANGKYPVTLNGRTNFKIEPRLISWSDWIDIDLPAQTFLKLILGSPNQTVHSVGLTISNDLIKTTDSEPNVAKYFFGVSAIQVQTDKSYERIAFFGDSLTAQGNFSSPLALDLENNFHIMTGNFGISGNRLLRPGNSTSEWSTSFGEAGYTRYDHMLVDYQPRLVIFMEGINDILHPGTGSPMSEMPTAQAVIDAIEQLRVKTRRLGITFVPMTITPANGNVSGDIAGWSDRKENLRVATNQELLKLPHVIDIATFVGEGDRLKREFDRGDHVHFSEHGGRLVAKYIEEQLIRKKMI